MADLRVLLVLAVAPLLVAATSNTTLYFNSEREDDPFGSQLNVKLSYEPYEETWGLFKKHYNRQYASKEEQYRYEVFMKNLKLIEQHNRKFFESQETYWMGVNQFTDMTVEEYREYNKLYSDRQAANSSNAGLLRCERYIPSGTSVVPASVDWRTQGYVTRVKNQADCGSCWAFSTTGTLEGQYYKAKKNLVSFSEQQLVDCSRDFGNFGCDGGYSDKTYTYINYAGGIETEHNYPYRAVDGRCSFRRSLAVTTVSGCYEIKQYSESDLKVAVATQGPVSIAIDSSHPSFKNYAGGLYYEPACKPFDSNHAVLVVGFGETSGGSQYWIVKNSWATTWGDKGYIYMARNMGNMCGIATDASFPVI